VTFSGEMADSVRGLKAFLFERVYRSPMVMEPVERSQKLLGELFNYYWRSGDLPGRWADAATAARGEAARVRVIADFVAGMTDPYAIDQHERLGLANRPMPPDDC
jgi:dGTPase